MRKDRLLKLADFLETVPRKAFDMGLWRTREATKPEGKAPGECGFAGCAMGWAAHQKLFRGLYITDWGLLEYREKPSDIPEQAYDAAAAVMGMSTDAAEHLFYVGSYETENPTPKQVAKRIRKFVESGGKVPA